MTWPSIAPFEQVVARAASTAARPRLGQPRPEGGVVTLAHAATVRPQQPVSLGDSGVAGQRHPAPRPRPAARLGRRSKERRVAMRAANPSSPSRWLDGADPGAPPADGEDAPRGTTVSRSSWLDLPPVTGPPPGADDPPLAVHLLNRIQVALRWR